MEVPKSFGYSPAVGLADAEIKVPYVENPELANVLPWSRSEYSHACVALCQEFLCCATFDVPSPFIIIFPPPNALPAF